MAEEGFDDFEMQDLGRSYPQYDDMNDEYDNLAQEHLNLLHGGDDNVELDNVKKRINYIECIREDKRSYNESSFMYSDDGETVKITRKGGRSQSAPEIEFPDTTGPENEIISSIEKFISDSLKKRFWFNSNNDKVIELKLNVNKTNNNNITFKPLNTRNERGAEKIVLKRDSNGVLQYNATEGSQKGVDK